MKKIILIQTEYKKNGNKWEEVKQEVKEINKEFYKNVIESKKFFTNLGGYERHEKSYTCEGYIVTKVTSISPQKEYKTVRQFNFN